MSIRDQAWTALLADNSGRVSAAKDGLRGVLDGLTVTLDLADVVRAGEGRPPTWVFTDGDVHLAVREQGEGWEVRLVVAEDYRWVEASPALDSLAQLGTFVPPLADGETAEAWKAGSSYAAGALVSHNGSTWRSGVDGNIWEPGAAGVHDFIWAEVA